MTMLDLAKEAFRNKRVRITVQDIRYPNGVDGVCTDIDTDSDLDGGEWLRLKIEGHWHSVHLDTEVEVIL